MHDKLRILNDKWFIFHDAPKFHSRDCSLSITCKMLNSCFVWCVMHWTRYMMHEAWFILCDKWYKLHYVWYTLHNAWCSKTQFTSLEINWYVVTKMWDACRMQDAFNKFDCIMHHAYYDHCIMHDELCLIYLAWCI